MSNFNVQHQIPMADKTLSSSLLFQITEADDMAWAPKFSQMLCFAFRISPRDRGIVVHPYVYNGPGSKSSPDFPRTGGTGASENVNVLLPFYLLLLSPVGNKIV